jgi:hypothetical protein
VQIVPLEHGGDGVERHVCQAWPAFFQLPVLMLMLITLLNDGALISVGYDHVVASPIPEQWNIIRLFIVATVMGAVAMGSSLLLLAAALDSNNPNGIFAGMYLALTTHILLSFGTHTNAMFLCVNFYVSDHIHMDIHNVYVVHLNLLLVTCYLRIFRFHSCSRPFNACRHGPASCRVWPGRHYDLSEGCSPPLPPPFLVCVLWLCVYVCTYFLCVCSHV